MRWPVSMTLSPVDRRGRARRAGGGWLVLVTILSAHPVGAQVTSGPAGAVNAGTGAVRGAPRSASPTVPLGALVTGVPEVRPVSVVGIDQQALSPRALMPMDMVLRAQSSTELTQLFCPADAIERCRNPQLRQDFKRLKPVAPDWQDLPVIPDLLSELHRNVLRPRCYVVVWKDEQNRTVQSLPFTLQQGVSNANSVCR
jgi:hypothetical protein